LEFLVEQDWCQKHLTGSFIYAFLHAVNYHMQMNKYAKLLT